MRAFLAYRNFLGITCRGSFEVIDQNSRGVWFMDGTTQTFIPISRILEIRIAEEKFGGSFPSSRRKSEKVID